MAPLSAEHIRVLVSNLTHVEPMRRRQVYELIALYMGVLQTELDVELWRQCNHPGGNRGTTQVVSACTACHAHLRLV